MPLLAQIAGYPGSGKTTICGLINQLYRDIVAIDTDDILSQGKDIRTEVNNFLHKNSDANVVLIGTFGYSPDEQKDEYPIFPAKYHWWLNMPLDVCMERALKRQVKACFTNYEKFLQLQKDKTMEEMSTWLNEYMNMKYRAKQWEKMKSLFLEHSFAEYSEDEIFAALSIGRKMAMEAD